MTERQVPCDYCGQPAVFLSNSTVVYHKNYGPLWRCEPCDAYVTCHPGTTVPLGKLANRELRYARRMAHAAFDVKWRDAPKHKRSAARHNAYAWLAAKLKMRVADTHIGLFNIEQCMDVVRLCLNDRKVPS